MIRNKISSKDKGFTIVELLVVIVVIGILAAITIVSYTGVTARANTASEQSAASALQGKIEVYAADGPTSTYPTTVTALTGAASSTTYYVSTSAVTQSTTLHTTAPTSPMNKVQYQLCGTNSATPGVAPANVGEITTPTGYKVGYWDFSIATPAMNNTAFVGGTTSGTGIGCFATAN